MGGDDPTNEGVVDDKTDSDTPKELKPNLGEYWNNSTLTTDGDQYVLIAIEAYGILHKAQTNTTICFQSWNEVNW